MLVFFVEVSFQNSFFTISVNSNFQKNQCENYCADFTLISHAPLRFEWFICSFPPLSLELESKNKTKKVHLGGQSEILVPGLLSFKMRYNCKPMPLNSHRFKEFPSVQECSVFILFGCFEPRSILNSCS